MFLFMVLKTAVTKNVYFPVQNFKYGAEFPVVEKLVFAHLQLNLSLNDVWIIPISLCSLFSLLPQRLSRAVQDSLASANTTANEVVSGIHVIRSFKTEKREAKRFDDRLKDICTLKTHRDMIRHVYKLAQRVRSLYIPFMWLCVIELIFL